MSAPRPPSLFGRAVRSVHAIGVAGMGLGPLAIYLAGRGFAVSGADDHLTEPMRRALTEARVRLTDPAEIPEDCELVVHSSAVTSRHPAWQVAERRDLPRVRRGELLAEVLRDRRLVAICGSHGKTTTTAMAIAALWRAHFPAGYVLGGLFADDALPPARAGQGPWVLAEIDESDGTIGQFSPEITVAVNLDWDHPDHYRRLEDLEATFAALFARTRAAILVHAHCERSRRRLAAQTGPASVYTFGPGGDFAARLAAEEPGGLRLELGGRFQPSRAWVRAHGAFNADNAAAALAAVQLIGAQGDEQLLAGYPGVRRRQAVLSQAGGVTVLEDYAHHPTEIQALLASLRHPLAPGARLHVVFQPHRFSRTAQFKSEFAAALRAADTVYLLDVYPAGEAPVTGGTTADLAAAMAAEAPEVPVTFRPEGGVAGLAAWAADARSGDAIAFVGAGDVDQMARAWLAQRGRVGAGTTTVDWEGLAAALRAALSPASRVRREESLAEKTTLRVGGPARLYGEPADRIDLQLILREARRHGADVRLLGRGSNLLVPDEGVDAVVVALNRPGWQEFSPQPDGRVYVGAGLRLKALCGLAGKAGLAGFEFLEGIPGNVGGALRMNAGAMGGWIFDVVESVELMTLEGTIETRLRAELQVDYRYCAELQTAIALGAWLRPAATEQVDAISRQVDTYRDKRQKTQPREPSAGCIFKNPPGTSAGWLIEASGLKGARVGGAEVSSVHANFIINRGGATGGDVIELVRRVRAGVRVNQGIELEPEVLLYGKEWKDVL